MPIATVKEFFEQRKRDIDAALAQAGPASENARKALEAARTASARILSEYADLDGKVAEARRAIPDAPMPPDAEALGEKLLDLLKQLRDKRSQRAAAEDALHDCEQAVVRESARLAKLGRDSAAATTRLQEAQSREKSRQEWKTAVGKPPLSSLKQDATTALASRGFIDAQKRLGDDLTPALRDEVVDRWKAYRTARADNLVKPVSGADDNLVKKKSDYQGKQGRAALAWQACLRTEAAVGDYVRTAKSRYDAAIDGLSRVKDSPALSPAVAAAIADKVAKVKKAVDAQKAADDALAAAPENDPDLNAKKKAVEDAKTASQDARKDRDLVVPDSAWIALAAFARLQDILNDFNNDIPKPDQLFADLVAAETALVDALVAEQKSLAELEDAAAQAEAANQDLVYADSRDGNRALAALRGENQ